MFRAADTIWRTDTGRQRRENEDNAFVRAPVFVVADGMGGAQAGEVASKIAVDEFRDELPDEGTPEERLTNRIQSANRRIYELSRTEHEHAGMGTTLTAVYLDDAHLAVAHVGDSRAYIFRAGTLTRLTQDHSLVEELLRQGKLTEEQAAEHPQRSIITRALGVESDVEVDTWSFPVHAADIVLLCSDGLTSMVREDEIAVILGAESDTVQAAERLIGAANNAGGRDNITVVLFRVEEIGGEISAADAPTVVGTPIPDDWDAPGGDGDGAAGRAQTVTAVDAPSTPTPVTPPPVSSSAGRSSASRTVPPPLARTQGPPGHDSSRRRGPRRFATPLAALIATAVVVFLFGGGGYLATRQLFFIGTNSNGIVTVYRGLPYDLPLGLRMYEQYYVSGVPVADVPAARRTRLLNHQLRSESDAVSLVHAAELGQLTR